MVAGQLISTDSRSCEHLVRYCIQGESTQTLLFLQFNLITDDDWLHLAEMRFHTNSSACPHDTIITPPPPPTTTPPPATTSPPAPATTNTSSQVPGPPQSTSITTMNIDSTGANLILIAVPASVAFLLLLALFMVVILIICKCKQRKPSNSLTRDVELEKYAPVSGDKPPLAGGSEAGASALHVQVYTEVNTVNHPTQTHQETESGTDQLYDQVDIKSNIRRVPPSAVTTENIVSQYSELQASDPVDQLYAQVDKKKGKKKKHGVDSQPSATPSSQAMAPSEPVDQLYAQVDKKQKGKKKNKEPADSYSSETVPSQPPVIELYAQVDKKKKRKKKINGQFRAILFRATCPNGQKDRKTRIIHNWRFSVR